MLKLAPQWAQLQGLAHHYTRHFHLAAALQADPDRVTALTLRAPHVMADLSKNLWDAPVRSALLALAQSRGLAQQRAAMWAGAAINQTEGRAVQHVHLRMPAGQGLSDSVLPVLDVAEDIVQQRRWTHLVHIGVGGSGLGPELCLQALQPYAQSNIQVHVVGNVDGHELHQVLAQLDPAHTLFVVVSKSWGTLETRLNAQAARQWLEADGTQQWADHALAVTACPQKAQAEGYHQVLTMPETVGGRFSLWSAVGLPLAVILGRQGFQDLLRGARDMDEHFYHAPLESNLPVHLAALDVWYATFLQLPSRCVVPYHHGLRRLPAYLQQLEMESNGKRVGTDGQPLPYLTAPAVWGEVGSNSQHAFFQWLHQGPQRTPVEFLLVAKAQHAWPEHQRWLHASALAQAKALMDGKPAGPEQLAGHQDFLGNRPSSMLLLKDLSPTSLGALLALYEHRTFAAGVFWGINSFDQWGVELGKQLAQTIEPALVHGQTAGLDASTAQLVQWLRHWQHQPSADQACA